ncbi:MAG: phage portal protein [Clostridium sp.]
MGIKNYFKNVFKSNLYRQAWSVLNDGTSIFSAFGEDVYLSDFVNNCIDRIATEISKTEIVSVLEKDNSVIRLNDDITRLFRFKPNELQTTKDFLSTCEWLRRKDCNCFIYPKYINIIAQNGITYRKYTGFYPLNPIKIELGVNEGDILEIKFYWKDGSYDILPYSDLIHLKWRRGKNTLTGGGNDFGNPDTTDLLKSVKILDKVIQGLPIGIEASTKIVGLFHSKSLVGNTKLQAEREDFEKHIFDSKSGIMATDLSGEFTPMNLKPTQIDPNTLKFVKSIIRERYGIADCIMEGDYDGEQHSAFYQNCIEDFLIEFEQAMTSCTFSQREQDVGHRIKGYYSKISYLSANDKINIANIATNVGNMTLNQINEMFGMQPFEGGDRRVQSLNYVNVDIADKYQLEGGIKNVKTEATE